MFKLAKVYLLPFAKVLLQFVIDLFTIHYLGNAQDQRLISLAKVVLYLRPQSSPYSFSYTKRDLDSCSIGPEQVRLPQRHPLISQALWAKAKDQGAPYESS